MQQQQQQQQRLHVACRFCCFQSLSPSFLVSRSALLLILARVTFPCLFIQTEAKSFCYNAGASPLGPAQLLASRATFTSTSFAPFVEHILLLRCCSCCHCCCCAASSCCYCACRRSKLRAINHFVCTLLHPFIQPERPMSPECGHSIGSPIDSFMCVCVHLCVCLFVCSRRGHLSRTQLSARTSISCLGYIFAANFAGAHKNHKTNTKQLRKQ